MRAESIVIVSVALLVSTPAAARPVPAGIGRQAAPYASQLEALEDDRIPGNAVAAYTALRRSVVGAPLDEELEAALAADLDAEDHQRRQFAASLLGQAYRRHRRPPASWPEALLDTLVEALADDDLRLLGVAAINNAQLAHGILAHALGDSPDEPRLVSRLLAALSATDAQQRNYAAWLLAEAFLDESRPASEWPEALIDALVGGLADDRIRGPSTFPNARVFYRILSRARGPRIEARVEALVRAPTGQARLPAMALLARYREGSRQAELAGALVGEMEDDRHFSNQYVALRALELLGEESVEAAVTVERDLDWQQAAILTLLAARFEIDWRAPPSHLQEWLRRGAGPRASHISLAAAYVVGAGRDGGNAPSLPATLRRMNGLSPGLSTPAERVDWASGWFWFLRLADQEDESVPLAARPI